MAKYHVTKDGNPGLCTATVKPCPLGEPDEHYDTPEQAREAYEKAMEAVPELSYKKYNKDVTVELSQTSFQEPPSDQEEWMPIDPEDSAYARPSELDGKSIDEIKDMIERAEKGEYVPVDCPECGGAGEVYSGKDEWETGAPITGTCSTCGGEGEVPFGTEVSEPYEPDYEQMHEDRMEARYGGRREAIEWGGIDS